MSEEHRAVFIDRDGTLIEDVGYPRRPDDVRLLGGAADAVRELRGAGLLVVVVTNQSGIARGWLTREDFESTQGRLAALLRKEEADLDGTYMCPHHPDIDGPCECRKPGPALYRQAATDLGIDLARSYYVGDRWRDVAVTETVGGTPIIVETGIPDREAPPSVKRFDTLAQATDHILESVSQERA